MPKRSSYSSQSSPPAGRGSPMYSPPYESPTHRPAKKPAPVRRTSSSVQAKQEDTSASAIDDDMGYTAAPPAESQSPHQAGTPALDMQNEKDDQEPDEDDNELEMDDDIKAQMEKAKEDMKLLLENFSDDQLQRYEAYRRSALNRTNVKRLVTQVMNQQCSQTMAFVVAGFTKVFVGEIVELARQVMEEWGDEGAIRPVHIREAHRRYRKKSATSNAIGKKMLL
ncbi:hTAFII28-like protein conserved region-domain-containing protein [Gongronella butleri]|nr:hTAFII28-like protein conserved region-domain-containing protein [Gongronella butleri]